VETLAKAAKKKVTPDSLQLRLAAPDEAAPPLPTRADVHVWRTEEGTPIAYGFRRGGRCWMHWPRLGTYSFGGTEAAVTAYPLPGASQETIVDVFNRSVQPMALHARGDEALHASAILVDAGVVAFAARSNTGKSTLAYGLSRRGYAQWADDAVMLRRAGDVVASVPLTFNVRLRQGSAPLFDDAQLEHRTSSTQLVETGSVDRFKPLAAICLLERRRGGLEGGAVVRQLTPAEAFPAVLTHALLFDPYDAERRRQMMEAYLNLAASVPVYEVTFTASPAYFPDLLDAITATVESGAVCRTVPQLSLT
jgi:hypothetical protein